MSDNNDSKRVVMLAEYDSAIDAEIVKGMLVENGINAGVIGDSTATAIIMSKVKVVVMEDDLERAQELLRMNPIEIDPNFSQDDQNDE